jgi:hypothetical protein
MDEQPKPGQTPQQPAPPAPEQPPQDVTISLHAPTDPPEDRPQAPAPGQAVAPQTAPAAPAAPAAQPPLPSQTIAPTQQPGAQQPAAQAAPAQPPGPVKVQWCPTDLVAILKPEAGNTCPACGTPLVPLPPEYGPETGPEDLDE